MSTRARRITVTLWPELGLYLDDLVETGLYGDTPEAVALSLIREGIIRACKSGFLKPRTFPGEGT